MFANLLATFLLFASVLGAQTIINPGGSGGTGTVTSVGLAGTANQITVTGPSPITSSGSWALSFPAGGVTLPGTTTGTFSGGLTGNVTGNASGSAGTTTSIASHASTELSDTALLARLAGPTFSGNVAVGTSNPTTVNGTTGNITQGGAEALGSELMPALTAGNWTVGAGWESPIVGPGLIKNANGTGTQIPSAATQIVAGTVYQVTIVVSAMSVGTATFSVGGTVMDSTGGTMTKVGTYVQFLTAVNTSNLTITPTNTSRFTITSVSVKAFTPVALTVPGTIFTSASDNRVIIGTSNTGQSSYGQDSVVAIGYNAGHLASQDQYSIHIGRHACSNCGVTGNATSSVQIGHAAGQFANVSQEAVQIGYLASQNANQAATFNHFQAVVIGSNAGKEAVLALHAVIIGDNAGKNAASCFPCVIIGSTAGQGTGTLDDSIMIGDAAGQTANSSGSTFIGTQAGKTLSTNNRLVIDSNTTYSPAGTTGLIYGEFDNRLLKVGGSFVNLKGTDVASATTTALGVGNQFHITGTTAITTLNTCDASNSGRMVRLIFDGILTFTDGNNLKLAGDFVTSADDTISLVCDGTTWYELARSVN